MLTPDEIDYLKKIPKDKKVKISPFDPKVTETAEEIINSIKRIYPNLETKHMGASALKISGQNDMDIYAFSDPSDFDKCLPGLIKFFGEPLHKHETFCEWKFKKEGLDVEFYLTAKDSETMKKQIASFEILKNNKNLVNEYQKLKESMNGKPFREYQEKKYEFYHKILYPKIKAILFDMVGELVFKKEDYTPKTSDEINAQNIENLFNHLDDKRLISDIREKLKLSDEEIERAVRLIPEKYEKFDELWMLLPELKKKFKFAVINNGNSLAMKYWKERFDFSIFDLFINSAEVGIKKPDPKVFLLACNRLDVQTKECLFLDDSLENIETANKLGMQTIWWSKEENKEDLLNKLINGYGFIRV